MVSLTTSTFASNLAHVRRSGLMTKTPTVPVTTGGEPATMRDGKQQKKKKRGKVAPAGAKPVAAAAVGGHNSEDEV